MIEPSGSKGSLGLPRNGGRVLTLEISLGLFRIKSSEMQFIVTATNGKGSGLPLNQKMHKDNMEITFRDWISL